MSLMNQGKVERIVKKNVFEIGAWTRHSSPPHETWDYLWLMKSHFKTNIILGFLDIFIRDGI